MSSQQGEPTEEQLREALKQLRVEDVLLQTVVTLVNVAGRKLTVQDEKDVGQAKLAIDGVRALLPLCPEEEARAVKDALAQLQMVYVREARQPAAGEEAPAEAGAEHTRADEERAKARAKIWTPPGS